MSNLLNSLNAAFEGGEWTRMPGTERTWEYVVVAATLLGRVGYRDFTHTGSPLRIRVEPTAGNGPFSALSRSAGWKQPGDDGQPRHSIVVPAGSCGNQSAGALKLALAAIQAGEIETLVNLAAPAEARALVGAAAAPTITPTAVSTKPAVTTAMNVQPIGFEPAHPKVAELLAQARGLAEMINAKRADAQQAVTDAQNEGTRLIVEAEAKAAELLVAAQAIASQRNTEAEALVAQANQLITAAETLNAAINAMAAIGIELFPAPAQAATPSEYTREQLEALTSVDLRGILRTMGFRPMVKVAKAKLVTWVLKGKAPRATRK